MAQEVEVHPLPGGDLAAFVAAVDAASIHAAADALNLTASAVTKRIHALERRLGHTLLERGRFGVAPTPSGQVLYPEARRALDALHRAESVITEMEDEQRRVVTIAASHTVGEFLLPGWLADFRQREPVTTARVEIINSPGVLESVAEGTAQIGFVEGTDDLGGVQTLPVYDDEMVVIVDPEHAWAGRSTVAKSDLAAEPYLTREAASGTRAVACMALGRAGLRLRPSLEAASTQAIKRSLGATGFSILSRLAVETELRAGTLCALAVDGVDLRRRLYAVRAVDARHEGAAAGLWDWLARQPRRPVARDIG